MVVPAGRAAAAAVCCAALSVSLSCRDSSPAPASPESIGESEVWSEVERLYELAKRKGEEVPKDVYEWAKEDVQAIGNWEYKVQYFSNPNHIALENQLNELGKERWDVIWIDRQGPNLIVTMKRPSRTWLNKLPLGQLLKLAAPGGDGASE